MVAVIVDAVRSPYGVVGGKLKGWHPVSLLAEMLKASVDRTGIDADRIERVIAGCATTIGEQAMNISRNAVLAAGWPESVASSTVDGQSIASLFALADVVAAINSGSIKVGVASGIESSTRVPDGATSGVAVGKPFGPLVHERYEPALGLVSPGLMAEAMAVRYGITRDEIDAYAELSRDRFKSAHKAGLFKNEIAPIAFKNDKGKDTASSLVDDELSKVSKAKNPKPLFEKDGLLTALTFSQPADGAAALLLADSQVADAMDWPVLARIVDVAIAGASPINGATGADLLKRLIDRNGLRKADVVRVDVFEDSAVTPLALVRDLKLAGPVLNPGGGALSNGVALGASAVAMVTSLAHGLANSQARYGAVVVAGPGGHVGAVLLERL